jgi:predicted transcriptional regulator
MSNELTETQETILRHAHEHTEGKIVWFPEHIKGGARQRVLDGLFNRALITQIGDEFLIAAEGYDALGVPRKAPISSEALNKVIEAAEAQQPRTRDNSKQAQVIAMLRRPEGATIAQICEATGWKQHTVRGTFAGAFKKKLGLEITSTKESGGQRLYRIS